VTGGGALNTAVVTGAASGMGRLVVEQLTARGVEVVTVDLDERALDEMAAADDRVFPLPCDVGDADQVLAAAKQALEHLGAVDRLVCAAGIGHGGSVLGASLDVLEQLVQVNYLGTVRWVHALAPAMVERGRGEIVLFASMAGWVPSPGMGPYCASKAAVVSLAESLHQELAPHGVRVLALCPPAVDTPMLDSFMVEGGVSRRGLKLVPPLPPEAVVDAIDPALRRGDIFAFPGSGTGALWRARRHTPGLVRALLRRLQEEPGTETPSGGNDG